MDAGNFLVLKERYRYNLGPFKDEVIGIIVKKIAFNKFEIMWGGKNSSIYRDWYISSYYDVE